VDFAYLINFTIRVGLRAAAALGIVTASIARVAAGAFGFLIFSHAFDGPDLYGAFTYFETIPSKPKLTNRLKHFPAVPLA
jgi:hypothetical protein